MSISTRGAPVMRENPRRTRPSHGTTVLLCRELQYDRAATTRALIGARTGAAVTCGAGGGRGVGGGGRARRGRGGCGGGWHAGSAAGDTRGRGAPADGRERTAGFP